MPDKRPAELIQQLAAISDRSDALIVEALSKLESPSRRGKMRLTVASICKMTGLARNTVRSRSWALERLKAIKVAEHQGRNSLGADVASDVHEVDVVERLRARVRMLLEQNAVLYEEILTLHRAVSRKDAEILQMKLRTIKLV